MIADDRNMRQLPYRQREYLSPAEYRITGQEHDWLGELCVTLRFDMPGLSVGKILFARASFCLPVEGDPLAVAKPIDDRDRNTIITAGEVPDIDDDAAQVLEVTGNLVKRGGQAPLFNAFQF